MYVAGVSTFTGIGTFAGDLYVGGDLYVADDVYYDEVQGRNLNVTGIATIATLGVSAAATTKDLLVTGVSTFTGIGTFSSDVYVDGNLNVVGDIVYDEVSGRNINISGLSTFEGLSYFGANVGIGTTNPTAGADSNNTTILSAGIVTANYFYGDISNATGVTTSITAAVGVSSEGEFVGTATVTPGASLGMVLALGG
jgi:hypothetical protein